MSLNGVIYVIDDDDAVRNSLQYALSAVGYRVEAYAQASAFLASARDECGVIISDVRMPGINGIELTRLLVERGSQIAIILLTGHADEGLKQEALSAGAVALLEKPARLDVLLAELDRWTANWSR